MPGYVRRAGGFIDTRNGCETGQKGTSRDNGGMTELRKTLSLRE